MKPRIYLYKVTFEETFHFYWGVHKEKKAGERYQGSPVTHAWMWKFYTPRVEILQFFDNWEQAQQIEGRVIKRFLNDPMCLNENCGGIVSLAQRKKGGLTTLARNREQKTGLHGMSKEELSAAAKKARANTTLEQYRKNGLNLSHEERVRRGKITTSQKWMCLETGYITTAPALSNYQRKRNIDTSRRKRVL